VNRVVVLYPRIAVGLLAALLLFGCARVPEPISGDLIQMLRDEYQAPLEEEDANVLVGEPSLHLAVRLAAGRNPHAQAARLRWRAAIEREPQAVTPPDPTARFGFQFDSVETRVGPQRWSLGVSQKVPWWRKLWARGRVAATQADITRLQYEIAMRETLNEVKDAWYELYYIDQALPITERIEEMLRNEAVLAYQELSVGRTPLNEALRAESQAAQLGYDRILLEERRATQAERLRSLLNLPPQTRIGVVRSAPIYSIEGETDELNKRAEHYAEVLKIKGLNVERARYETYLAKLARIPDPTIGFNLVKVDSVRAPMMSAPSVSPATSSPPASASKPSDSGKDAFIGLISMNLPIWEWRNRALIREQEALEGAMEWEALREVNRVRAAVAGTWFDVQLTGRLVDLYVQTLIPQAESVMRQAELYFRADQASLSNLIESTLAWHNFQLALHRARADHGQALARLEQVLGTTAEPRETGEGDQP